MSTTETITPPKIGEYWQDQGGFYAGIVRDTKTNVQWHLILAEGQAKEQWGKYGKKLTGCDNVTDGIANTKSILEQTDSDCAATWASKLSIDGHEDFYLPAQKELNLIYVNLQDKCSDDIHWSSTQCSAYTAWSQHFEDGCQGTDFKDGQLAVRAVRRLPL